MGKALRKSLVLEILGEEISVEVDFRLIEIMERAFNQSADMVIAHFVNVENVQRRHVADILADVLGRKADVKFTRTNIREFILTADAEAYYVIVAQLQAALLFTLRHMTGEEYDKAAAELAAGSKKKTEALPEDSSGSATK